MTTYDECMSYAAEAERLAATAEKETDQRLFLMLAEQWLDAATMQWFGPTPQPPIPN